MSKEIVAVTHPPICFFSLAQSSTSVKRKTCLSFLAPSTISTMKLSFSSCRLCSTKHTLLIPAVLFLESQHKQIQTSDEVVHDVMSEEELLLWLMSAYIMSHAIPHLPTRGRDSFSIHSAAFGHFLLLHLKPIFVNIKDSSFKETSSHPQNITSPTSPTWLTSPFFRPDWRRAPVSSLILDRKFWEILKASCRSGWSGWLLGVCLSKSWGQQRRSHT